VAVEELLPVAGAVGAAVAVAVGDIGTVAVAVSEGAAEDVSEALAVSEEVGTEEGVGEELPDAVAVAEGGNTLRTRELPLSAAYTASPLTATP
jgi:hypothetical protein